MNRNAANFITLIPLMLLVVFALLTAIQGERIDLVVVVGKSKNTPTEWVEPVFKTRTPTPSPTAGWWDALPTPHVMPVFPTLRPTRTPTLTRTTTPTR